jgi:hypothetical protein
MIQFIADGIYIFNPNMRLEYPNSTLLDLHIHAYLVGSKYEVPKLCAHAIDEYINIGEMTLSMGITPDDNPTTSAGDTNIALIPAKDVSTNNTNNTAVEPTYAAYKDSNTSAASAVLDSFLDSLVLLWRNTPNRDDAMRQAVLELLKSDLHQLMQLKFFQTLLMEMVAFGDDMMHSLADDGFDVKAFPVRGHLQRSGVRFGGA